MTVYIAAPWPMQASGRMLRTILAGEGIGCTSRWLDLATIGPAPADDALADIADLLQADALVALNPPNWRESGTGGRHVEWGIALQARKPTVLHGDQSHVFHALATVHVPWSSPLLDLVAAIQRVQVPS